MSYRLPFMHSEEVNMGLRSQEETPPCKDANQKFEVQHGDNTCNAIFKSER